MNGFQIMAKAYKKNGQERKAELYEFLGNCSNDDICMLFDSSAFNEIAKGYLRRACEELEREGVLDEDEEQGKAVQRRFSVLFSEKTAKEVL